MKQPSARKSLSYRADVDGLRAIAVLSVVAYHLAPTRIQGGFVGVDIFFVISGFLISSIIYKELETGQFSIVAFYIRRIRRIYPALFLVLACVCVAGWFLLLPHDFVLLGKQIIGGSTFVANFVLWWQSGYFSPEAAQKPLLHLWSLGVEEQYYLIFPLICAAFYGVKSRWNLAAVFLAIALTSMTLNLAFAVKYAAASFFLPFSRLWELFLGAGLSLFLRRQEYVSREKDLSPAARDWSAAAGLGLLGFAILGTNQYHPFPGWRALLPTIGAALIIFAGPSSWINRYLLSSRPAVFIGLISYPVYLWHWPILAFTRIAKRVWNFDFPHLLKYGIALALTFLLSYVTYRFVELPIRSSKSIQLSRKIALGLLGCVAATGVFGVFVVWAKGFPGRFESAINTLDHDFASDAKKVYRAHDCFLSEEQSAAAFNMQCIDTAPELTNEPLALFWGDSHAADLVPGFRALQSRLGVRLAQYTASTCAPILDIDVPGRPGCAAVNAEVLSRIRVLRPDTVVLSAFWDYVDLNHNRLRAAQLQQTIELVKAAGVTKIVVIGSAPFWTNDVPILLLHELNGIGRFPARLSRELLISQDDTVLKAAAAKSGAFYVSLVDALCDQKSCLVSTGQDWKDVLTYDAAHFTEHGSMLVAEAIWAGFLKERTQ